MSYGANYPALFRRAADIVDKILRGTKPGDIPVEQPTKFDLVVNLKAAKALGLTVPTALLATADEVIRGAHCPVVVMKRGNARGAKGAGHRR